MKPWYRGLGKELVLCTSIVVGGLLFYDLGYPMMQKLQDRGRTFMTAEEKAKTEIWIDRRDKQLKNGRKPKSLDYVIEPKVVRPAVDYSSLFTVDIEAVEEPAELESVNPYQPSKPKPNQPPADYSVLFE